jgi:integrase/recombinase XerD
MPGCCVHSGCIGRKHDAVKATKKAQRRGQVPLPAARHADPFGMVGNPLPTSFDAGVDLRDVQIATRHADPRTMMRYDRARTNLDRHPNYILAAYMSSAT